MKPMFASQICVSSNRNDWATPQALFDALNKEFGFTVDVCASDWNAKMPRFWSIAQDSLSLSWAEERCFMNPPYGREIGKWVAKAHGEAQRGALVVGLIPARTDTRYWHDHIQGKAEVRFIRGRVKFKGYNLQGKWCENSPSTFPSVIVVWRSNQ
jgi:site-specific DNA-methyltransferase (adenine-specific)